jgi:predicted phosphate transport protein (TIGR00153 family)
MVNHRVATVHYLRGEPAFKESGLHCDFSFSNLTANTCCPILLLASSKLKPEKDRYLILFKKISLFPRDERFSILFLQEAENIVKMANEFKELVVGWENAKERVRILTELERDGDAITHEVIALLHRTFITPFDREDINHITLSLDDIADRIHQAADIMFLYHIEKPTDKAKELAEVILQIAKQIENAVSGFRGRIDQNKLLKQCVEINRLENVADGIYRSALAELFSNTSDISYVVKWREIYQIMEYAANAGESTANVIEGIALKYT